MKQKGKILNWNDDRGFGFVETDGGERAFVHIKAFKNRSRRPANGEVIIYDLASENNEGFKAENIQYALDIKSSNKRKINSSSCFGVVLIIALFIGLLLSVSSGKLPVFVIGLYVFMSLATFVAYAIDKFAAQHDRWRTKESTLHFFSLTGGWPGAFFAQIKLRHKSSKAEFRMVYWGTVLLNLVGLLGLHTESGARLLTYWQFR